MMKAKIWVKFERECEIDVAVDDFIAAIHDSEDFLRVMICAARVFSVTTDDQITSLNDGQRRLMSEFLAEQSKRIAPLCIHTLHALDADCES